MLPKFIEYAISKNYTFVSLSECLSHDNAYNGDNEYGALRLH